MEAAVPAAVHEEEEEEEEEAAAATEGGEDGELAAAEAEADEGVEATDSQDADEDEAPAEEIKKVVAAAAKPKGKGKRKAKAKAGQAPPPALTHPDPAPHPTISMLIWSACFDVGPKRALSAFIYFSKEKRPEVKTNGPDLSFGEIGKELGRWWKELTPVTYLLLPRLSIQQLTARWCGTCCTSV